MLWLVVLLGGSGGTGGIRGALGGKRCDVVIPTLNPITTKKISEYTCDEGMFAHSEDGGAKRRQEVHEDGCEGPPLHFVFARDKSTADAGIRPLSGFRPG